MVLAIHQWAEGRKLNCNKENNKIHGEGNLSGSIEEFMKEIGRAACNIEKELSGNILFIINRFFSNLI